MGLFFGNCTWNLDLRVSVLYDGRVGLGVTDRWMDFSRVVDVPCGFDFEEGIFNFVCSCFGTIGLCTCMCDC